MSSQHRFLTFMVAVLSLLQFSLFVSSTWSWAKGRYWVESNECTQATFSFCGSSRWVTYMLLAIGSLVSLIPLVGLLTKSCRRITSEDKRVELTTAATLPVVLFSLGIIVPLVWLGWQPPQLLTSAAPKTVTATTTLSLATYEADGIRGTFLINTWDPRTPKVAEAACSIAHLTLFVALLIIGQCLVYKPAFSNDRLEALVQALANQQPSIDPTLTNSGRTPLQDPRLRGPDLSPIVTIDKEAHLDV